MPTVSTIASSTRVTAVTAIGSPKIFSYASGLVARASIVARLSIASGFAVITTKIKN